MFICSGMWQTSLLSRRTWTHNRCDEVVVVVVVVVVRLIHVVTDVDLGSLE